MYLNRKGSIGSIELCFETQQMTFTQAKHLINAACSRKANFEFYYPTLVLSDGGVGSYDYITTPGC